MSNPVNEILTGDALSVLKTLPDNYVQVCVTSPPYYALRDYGVPGQIGLEPTPEEYIQKLVEVFREVRRILKPSGTLWCNIGDSYVGGNYRGGGTENASEKQRSNAGTLAFMASRQYVPPGYKPKDLYGIPWMLAFALRADGWWLRADCIWAKGNPLPESVQDRPTRSHEYVFLLAKSEHYFYDGEAIKEPLKRPEEFSRKTPARFGGADKHDGYGTRLASGNPYVNVLTGRNKRSVWHINPHPYQEAHFATMPPKLVEICVLAGSSPKACELCLSPWERVTETTGGTWEQRKEAGVPMRYGLQSSKGTPVNTMGTTETRTLRWRPTCSCKNEGTGKCIVLDPFMGAGTVALVASQHARHYLGIELNPEYVRLAEKRIACVQVDMWESEGIA